MEEGDGIRKKMKNIPTPTEIKDYIFKTKHPLVLKHVLSWDVLNWSINDWIEKFGNQQLDVRIGTKQCTKVPQWESICESVPASLRVLLDEASHESSGTWMYFDYKHMKHHLKKNPELLESFSWADFGFPDKSGKDSTIWIGTQGAYTSCHMDSYGCNIVAQVYGRKLWVMFPPSKSSVLKPTRVPYEESSVYSNIHFSCGLNITEEIGTAHVVELSPGDVLIVPRHWWHYVENLSTAISINMWIPLESDNDSRLEESLVRFFVASTLGALDIQGETPLLNPNELDLLDEKVDMRQISWCLDQMLKRGVSSESESSPMTSFSSCVSTVPTLSAEDLRQLLLKKCGCVQGDDCADLVTQPLSVEHVINAFCHPDVIAKVAQFLISTRKS